MRTLKQNFHAVLLKVFGSSGFVFLGRKYGESVNG
jgi:hypothetical protein